MQEQITARLDELKQEYSRGQTRLQELDIQQAALRETMMRISGAIQVLEELLEQQPAGGAGGEDAGSGS